MTIKEFAREELERIEKLAEADSPEGLEMQKEVTKNVMDLMEVFSKQGHSVFSANYIANLFDQLIHFRPLTSLTGKDDEWESIDGGDYQNKRCPSVFKTADGHVHDSNYWYKEDKDTGLAYRDIDCFQGIHFPYMPGKPKLFDLKETDDVCKEIEIKYIKETEEIKIKQKAEELAKGDSNEKSTS